MSTDTPDDADRCQQLSVARSPAGSVTLCRHCRQVHLELQYMTLRFDADAFRELAGLLVFSQRRIDSDPSLGAQLPNDPPPAGLMH